MTPYRSDEALESLRESKKRVEKSLTPRARAFRRLKGGRPKNLGFDKPTSLQVVCTLFSEIKKIHQVMKEEGLDPKDLNWVIFYYLPTLQKVVVPEHPSSRRIETTTRGAIELLEFFDTLTDPLFLKITWSMDPARWTDKEGEGMDEYVPDWETLLNAYPLDSNKITAALEEEKLQKK
jgi:hypothetical protein